MPKFRTQYDLFKVESVTGSPFAPEFSAFYDADGVLELELVGKKDVYAEIQSYKDSVDINVILKRFEMGDASVLSKVQGFYEDVSDMPQTYQEVLNSVIQSEQFFDSLPVEEKKKFDNSFSQFMVALGEPDFLEKYYNVPSPSEPVPAPSEPVSNDGGVVADE